MTEQFSLFEPGPSAPLPRATSLDRTGRAKWTRHKSKNRVRCDECVIVLHENNGKGPYPKSARWTRRLSTADGVDVKYLCHEHAEAWKQQETS